jgi:hypothetical protein
MKIVYLIFAPNAAYNQVVEEKPKNVQVDEKKGTWTWKGGAFDAPQKRKIGEPRYLGDRRFGVIGVYDADNLQHLGSMVHAAVESQRDYSRAD